MAPEHERAHDHGHDHHHPHAWRPGDFTTAKPILNVASVPASLAYYMDKLRFELVFAWCDGPASGDPALATFGEVRRGAAAIMLAQGEQGGPGMWIYCDLHTAAEVDALHDEIQQRGGQAKTAPCDRPWGMREMLITDLDGHVLRVGGPLDHA